MRNRVDDARMRSRSRNASRVQRMSAGIGTIAGSASHGAITGQLAPLPASIGRPTPKLLLRQGRSMALHQAPLSELLRSSDLLRRVAMPPQDLAPAWLNAA